MNKILITPIAVLAALPFPASAATLYNGSGPIDQAGSWNNGIPNTAGNPGTINSATGTGNLRSGTYFITQNGGTLDNPFGGVGLSGGNWTLEDGSVQATSNDLTLSSSQVFTQNGGSVTAGADDFIVTSGASYMMNNGTLSVGDDTTFTGGTITIHGGTFTTDVFNANIGSFTITGGALNVNTLGNTASFQDGGMTLNFSGGTTAVTGSFGLYGDTNPNSVLFGGTHAGSLTATGLVGTANGTMNWLFGSQMSMTITGSSTWAETEYLAGRLLYNGDDFSDLGLTWTEATSGGTAIWDYSGNTLSLIPEPTGLSLLGFAFGAAMFIRRRPHE